MKVLMVGLGAVGQRHARNLRVLLGNEMELLAYRVRRLSRTITPELTVAADRDAESELGVRAFDDLDSALAQRPSLALICNPTSLHIPIAMRAAGAGCHLFVEKPLSNSLVGTEELAAALDQQQRVGLVGYQMRFHPCLRRVKELLEISAVGAIISVHAHIGEDLRGWHKYEDFRQSYAARADLGGGVILTQIHEMDYLFWLFGMPRRLFTVGGRLSRLKLDVEDTASTLMEYDILGRKVPVHLHQNYLQSPARRTLEIVGDAGTITVDFIAPALRVSDEHGALKECQTYSNFERNCLFMDEMRHLVNCVRGGETPVVSIRDGTRSLQMALAAKTSMVSGHVVDYIAGNFRSEAL